jgi:hypothetical protein
LFRFFIIPIFFFFFSELDDVLKQSSPLFDSQTTPINYAKLPNLTISMQDTTNGTVNITLNANNYIKGDGRGNIYFAIQPQETLSVVMGATLFDTFYIVLDRGNNKVGFGPGCECQT